MGSPSSVSRLASRLRFLAVATGGAYAAINVLLALLAPLTQGWPTLGVTAVAVPPMVLAMVYGVIPIAFRLGSPR